MRPLFGRSRRRSWERRVRRSFGWPTRRFIGAERPVFHYANPRYPDNWGDVIASTICSHFSGRTWRATHDPLVAGKLLAVGSVLHFAMPGDVVWGAGVLRPKDTGAARRRLAIHAVRGPLTRRELERAGYQVPQVYGDPALLYPRIRPRRSTDTVDVRWGIVAHYAHATHPILRCWAAQGARIIDVRGGIDNFVAQLLSVERIASSSLHGLILADPYGIPNVRLELSTRLVGGDLKFEDHAQSLGRAFMASVRVRIGDPLSKLESARLNEPCDFAADPLLEAAPWS